MAAGNDRSSQQPGEGDAREAGSSGPLDPSRAVRFPIALGVLLAGFALLPASRENPSLQWSFVGAGVGLLCFAAVLAGSAARSGRTFAFSVVLRKQHYMQAFAQLSIFVYWGYYWRDVYAYAVLIAAQLVFAYAFDALLTWCRRDRYVLGFGPFPVIFSINLFLWFRPDWFYLQLLMVAVGFAAKELIQWTKGGRKTHIFNPSSFPLSVFSIGLILTGTTEISWGVEIARTQIFPPHIYLLIFAASLPGQFLFGVASMTLSAIATTYGLNLAFAAITGSYIFVDAYVPIAVFLGMHLLFNDPSTSPRSDFGRVLFGVFYGSSVLILYVGLGLVGLPTFYDKLLGVPILNMLIQAIDRLAESPGARRLDPTAKLARLDPRRRNLVYMSIWALLFVSMQAHTRIPVSLERADLLLTSGRHAEAIAHYRELLEDEPDHPAANANLGFALVQLGRIPEALPLLQRTLELGPDTVNVLSNLGQALMIVGETEAAVAAMQRAVDLAPRDAVAHRNLGLALAEGDPTAAVAHFEAALDARPDWPKALGALAWVRATHAQVHDPQTALVLALRAAELSRSRDVEVLDVLAAAYASVGRYEEAIQTGEAAEAIALESVPRLVEGIRSRLDLYRAGRPVLLMEP